MKIPLIYPKIPENSNQALKQCIAFEKYDGTNLHWCWNKSDGWHSFGTRRTQFLLTKQGIEEFNKEHYELTNAPGLFNDYFRDCLSIFLASSKYKDSRIVLFTEFYGPNSFAGGHSEEDQLNDEQKLVVIDALVNGKMLDPEVFVKDFACVSTAKIIYIGKYNGQFTDDVRNSRYAVNEGVVIKGVIDNEVFMTKVKTKAYIKKLEKR